MADGVTSGRLRGRDLERPFRGARLLPTGALLDDGPLAIDRRKRDRVRLRAVERFFGGVLSLVAASLVLVLVGTGLAGEIGRAHV